MNLKDKFKSIRNKLLSLSVSYPKGYEFDADLADHEIGNQNIYRQRYVDFHRINSFYETDRVGVINLHCNPFMLPDGMTREEGFKVLSYLTNFIEKTANTRECSYDTVELLEKAIDLERFGFTRIEESDESKIIDLFTVDGRLLLFKKSHFYQKYFNWYSEGITKEEIESIYSKYGMEFQDIIWPNNAQEDGYSRKLTNNSQKEQ